MTDKEIITKILDDTNTDIISMTDDDNNTFDMEQLGVVPLHGVVYAILDLLKINGIPVSEEDAGVVMLELDFDPEANEYFIQSVEDDDIFDEVIQAYEAIEE